MPNKLKTPIIALIGAMALLASAPAFAQSAAPADSATAAAIGASVASHRTAQADTSTPRGR